MRITRTRVMSQPMHNPHSGESLRGSLADSPGRGSSPFWAFLHLEQLWKPLESLRGKVPRPNTAQVPRDAPQLSSHMQACLTREHGTLLGLLQAWGQSSQISRASLRCLFLPVSSGSPRTEKSVEQGFRVETAVTGFWRPSTDFWKSCRKSLCSSLSSKEIQVFW